MAGETNMVIIGTLTADAEIRFTPSGQAVCNFTVASNPRFYDKDSGQWKDGEPLFLRCNAWRGLAENIAESLQKGNRVIVYGKLQQRTFETKDGDKRSVLELTADEVGPSLKWSTATVRKAGRSTAEQQDTTADQWASAPPAPTGAAGFGTEPPF